MAEPGSRIGGGRILIIAEAGVNHNGDLDLAKKLVDSAKGAGADCVKFQTFKAESIVSADAGKTEYQLRSGNETQQEMLKKLELSYEGFRELKARCDDAGIEFLSTPYDVESVEFLSSLGVQRIKIASADIVHKSLLNAAAESGRQVILSTGMATLEEVERAVNYISSLGNQDIVILHCTTSYPTKLGEVNMASMLELAEKFDYKIGYSDHTEGIEVSLMAASMGAEVIERHLTLDRGMPGPDHFASLEPDELNALVHKIRVMEADENYPLITGPGEAGPGSNPFVIQEALGSGYVARTAEEAKNIWFMRKSLHAAHDIPKGKIIELADITVRRPNDGASPWDIEEVVGKAALKALAKGDPIALEDV